MRPNCLIVTPALASANNGNWHTARRWQYYAAKLAQTRLSLSYEQDMSPTVAIALHAYRSADSVIALADKGIPVALVLTGTDLYRDIRSIEKAQTALQRADILVVLNEQGLIELPPQVRSKARCIFQSAYPRKRARPAQRHADFSFVGHLRQEKDPLTPVRALALLDSPRVRLKIAGAEHISKDGVVDELRQLVRQDPRVSLLGGVPHARARDLIGRSRALIVSSVMEGGANVLIEAVTSGVPVLASRVAGNIGMLGNDYPGYFELGNERQLAGLMRRVLDDQEFLRQLENACAKRCPLFLPARERQAVQQLVSDLLQRQPAA